MSLPEVMLWQRLRTRPLGVKFRRQHPIDRYVVDFYCPYAKIAVEIDGEVHTRGDRPQRDEVRNAFLASKGIRVVRIAASDVLRDPDAVAASLATLVAPLHRPAGGPPPHASHGEDRSE